MAALWLRVWLWGWAAAAAAGLYAGKAGGPRVLEAGTVRAALRGSAWAWLLQFYSSACGHCVAFAPAWAALARDVRGWEAAIRVGALDCGDEGNRDVCREFGIRHYPAFRYFRAFTTQFTTGENQHGSDRELQIIRQSMIDFLQNHSQETKPPACPPLEPIAPEDMFSFFGKHAQHYTAIIFETASSYVGREVILDLIEYENIVVKRMLSSFPPVLQQLGITSVPSSYLIYPNGSHGLINVFQITWCFFLVCGKICLVRIASSKAKFHVLGYRNEKSKSFGIRAERGMDQDNGITQWHDKIKEDT